MGIFGNIIDRIFVPQGARLHLKGLLHNWPQVRAMSAKALADYPHPKVVERLIDALRDDDPSVREAAAGALGRIGKPALKPIIWRAKYRLFPRQPWEKSELLERISVDPGIALRILEDIGAESMDFLLEIMENKRCFYRWDVAGILGRIRDPRAVPLLVEALSDYGDSRISQASHIQAADALGMIGDSRAVEPLIRALKAGSRPLARHVASALGAIGDPEAVGPLVEEAVSGYDEEGCKPRVAAVYALGAIGDPGAIEALKKLTQEEDGELALAAQRALNRIKARIEKPDSSDS